MNDDFEGIMTLHEIEEALASSIVNPNMYVYYNTTGAITSISNVKTQGVDYLEVPESKLVDFLSGKRDFAKYKIDFFKFNKPIEVVERKPINPVNILNLVSRVKEIDVRDIVIVHSKEHRNWHFTLSNDGLALVKQQNLDKTYNFYVVENSDPHYLVRTVSVTGQQLIDGVAIPFKTKLEAHVDKVGVATMMEFNSYGLLVK